MKELRKTQCEAMCIDVEIMFTINIQKLYILLLWSNDDEVRAMMKYVYSHAQ